MNVLVRKRKNVEFILVKALMLSDCNAECVVVQRLMRRAVVQGSKG